MDEKAMVREMLERSVGQKLPSLVWKNEKLQGWVDAYLAAQDAQSREDYWSFLEEDAERLSRLVEEAKAEALEGVKASLRDGDRAVREAARGGREREGRKLEAASFVGAKTTAMLQAMSELFAGLAHQYPKVVEFRDKVLGSRWLTEDEAHEFLASYAARFFTFKQFSDWKIPIVGHTSKLVQYDHGLDKDEIDHRATLRVDPPGITKTVRYAFRRKGDPDTTRCVLRGERFISQAIVPPNQRGVLAGGMPTVVRKTAHKTYTYPRYLWPGSVVDNLYDLAEALADAFDWPGRDSAAWFILTGKAPEVRPIDARWKTKGGASYLNPQWRIRLTIPPWLPEKEVLQAYRRMWGMILEGTGLPKTSTPLEVARFVWERERLNGYERPPWTTLFEQWNEEYPGARFETYNNFRTYFTRGDKRVKELNFSWPQPDEKSLLEETFDALKKALDEHPRLKEMSAWDVLTNVPAEEVARLLVQGGYLEEEPSSPLVEEALRGIDVEEQALASEAHSGERI